MSAALLLLECFRACDSCNRPRTFCTHNRNHNHNHNTPPTQSNHFAVDDGQTTVFCGSARYLGLQQKPCGKKIDHLSSPPSLFSIMSHAKQARQRVRTSPYSRTMKAIQAFDLHRMSKLFFRSYPNIRKWKSNRAFEMTHNVRNARESVHVSISPSCIGDRQSFAELSIHRDNDGSIYSAEVELCFRRNDRTSLKLSRDWILEHLRHRHYHVESDWNFQPSSESSSDNPDWTTAVADVYRLHGDCDKILIDWVEHYMKVISIYVRGSPSLQMLQSMRLL